MAETNDARVFDLLRTDAPSRTPDIARELGFSRRSTESCLNMLRRKGLIRIEGGNGGRGGRLCSWYRVAGAVRPVDGRGGARSRKNLLMGPPARKQPKPKVLKPVPPPKPYILDELWPMRREAA